MSTNKVYGDAPNHIPLKELDTRWDYDDPAYKHGIPETFTIDQSKHSLFGASKVAADIMVQEYGRYFHMPTCCLRGGCLTGPNHSGVELHGFLSYLIKCNMEEPHVHHLRLQRQTGPRQYPRPRRRLASCGPLSKRLDAAKSITSAAAKTTVAPSSKHSTSPPGIPTNKMQYTYTDQNREGDHICYYSDLRKMKSHYPNWDITKTSKTPLPKLSQAGKSDSYNGRTLL